MMWRRAFVIGVSWGALSVAAHAETLDSSAAKLVLEKTQSASKSLAFTGTFVHQQDSVLHTSKIFQRIESRQPITKVQTLEGHQREIIKTPTETRIYMAERQHVKVDQTGQPRAAFPAMFVGTADNVVRNYEMVKGGAMRIADVDAQEYMLKPKHDARWPVRFWVDKRTGLIMKCQKLGSDGRAVEQASFTELNLSARPSTGNVSVSFAGARQWETHDASLAPLASAPNLKFKPDYLKGFELVGVYQKPQNATNDTIEIRRYVFSDGVASVSVFIQPKSSGPLTERARRKGSLSMLSREIQGAWVTVIGDLPPEALNQFAQTIEWK
jgi:sigma-E factor negative regulatory protein RseB